MKKLLFAILALAWVMPALAQNTYDYAVKIDEAPGYLRYFGTLDFSTDSTGNHYSQAMLIAGANASNGGIKLKGSAASMNVNFTLQYSDDLLNWIDAPLDSNLLAISNTTKFDTLGYVWGSESLHFRNSKYLRLKGDGQSGSRAGTMAWSVLLRKEHPVARQGFAANKR